MGVRGTADFGCYLPACDIMHRKPPTISHVSQSNWQNVKNSQQPKCEGQICLIYNVDVPKNEILKEVYPLLKSSWLLTVALGIYIVLMQRYVVPTRIYILHASICSIITGRCIYLHSICPQMLEKCAGRSYSSFADSTYMPHCFVVIFVQRLCTDDHNWHSNSVPSLAITGNSCHIMTSTAHTAWQAQECYLRVRTMLPGVLNGPTLVCTSTARTAKWYLWPSMNWKLKETWVNSHHIT